MKAYTAPIAGAMQPACRRHLFPAGQWKGYNMKLLRWAVAGASAYAIYKYSIGKKAKGENVLESPEATITRMTSAENGEDAAPVAPAAQS